MSIVFKLERSRIQKLLFEIDHGRPIRPVGRGWPVRDLLELAGVCRFLVLSAGPQAFGGLDSAKMQAEGAKAASNDFLEEVGAAIELQSSVAERIRNGDWENLSRADVTVTIEAIEGEVSAESVSDDKDLSEHEN